MLLSAAGASLLLATIAGAVGSHALTFADVQALRSFETSDVLKAAFGEATVASYAKLRHADWNDYARHLTDWERRTTLDC